MSTDGGFGTGSSDAQQSLQSFWPRVMEEIRNLTVEFLFLLLQRNDIAMAITKFDQFDFLIDIVPRDELKPPKRQEEVLQAPDFHSSEPLALLHITLTWLKCSEGDVEAPLPGDVSGEMFGHGAGGIHVPIPIPGVSLQVHQAPDFHRAEHWSSPFVFVQTTPVTMQVGEGQQVQIVQAQPQGQSQQAQSGTGQTMQVMQQIITNTGEIQQIPRFLCHLLCLQQLYQIQQVTMPAGQDITQPMFIQSTNQSSDTQATQVTGD
nr:nuclear transcription factor Y subunit gamma-like [Zonotrichia albicollis]